MIEAIKYRLHMRELQRDRVRMQAEFDESIKQAATAKDREKEQGLISEMFFEVGLIDTQIGLLQTRRLRELAERHLIPIPEFGEEYGWKRSEQTGQWHLNAEVAFKLRREIDEERKRSRDRWLSWAAALTGLFGAATGLAAILAAWPKE